jgi:hypothetical protein
MKRALLGLLIACMTMGLASVASAGENAIAGISLHITKPVTKLPCDNLPTYVKNPGTVGAAAIDSKGQPCPAGVGTFSVWLIVCNGSDSLGVAGLECGIEYDGALGSGVDIDSWTLCGDLEFSSGNWPAAGSGNLITWEPTFNCQDVSIPDPGLDAEGNRIFNHSVIATAGVFQVTSYGRDNLIITPRPVSGRAKVADCRNAEDDITFAVPSQLGIAGFCRGLNGYNFCQPLDLPTQGTTWGKIKSQY